MKDKYWVQLMERTSIKKAREPISKNVGRFFLSKKKIMVILAIFSVFILFLASTKLSERKIEKTVEDQSFVSLPSPTLPAGGFERKMGEVKENLERLDVYGTQLEPPVFDENIGL